MSRIVDIVVTSLGLLALALGVRLLVEHVWKAPYSIVLVLVGFLISVSGIEVGIVLSHDLIMTVLLPAIVFHGAVEIDLDSLRKHALVPVVLVIVGLPLAVGLLGWGGVAILDLPPLVALLFAAIILPTDPATVLAVFEDTEAPERLSVVIEGESLFNDGVGIAIVTTLLAFQRESAGTVVDLSAILSPDQLASLALTTVYVSLGGFLLGVLIGTTGHRLTRDLDDRMATVLFTVLIAYGSYLLGESLGVSGVLAVVGAGLPMGADHAEFTERPEYERFVRDTWDTAVFVISTLIYLLVGTQVRTGDLAEHFGLVVVATIGVVVVRGVVIYSSLAVVNAVTTESIPLSYQHVMVWGGLHTVVPVALALGLPSGVPFRPTVQTIVFGVAVLGTIAQGLLVPAVLTASGVVE